ncbi:MAG: leucine-rich repeat domain-containing protein [Eubacterium sp.]|nr:leucine-rich repeat domain-containing protein [Eubacterium sp.]
MTKEPTETENGIKTFTCLVCKETKTEEIKNNQLKKNAIITDKKSAGKYKITAVTVKNGKVVGGTVTYMKPYNMNCKTATVGDTVEIDGVIFKVTTVANNAFKGCGKLTKVTVGKNVTKIGSNAFNGCSHLKNVIFKTSKLKKIGKNAFKGINAKAKFKVPKTKLKKYKKLIKKARAPKKAKVTK